MKIICKLLVLVVFLAAKTRTASCLMGRTFYKCKNSRPPMTYFYHLTPPLWFKSLKRTKETGNQAEQSRAASHVKKTTLIKPKPRLIRTFWRFWSCRLGPFFLCTGVFLIGLGVQRVRLRGALQHLAVRLLCCGLVRVHLRRAHHGRLHGDGRRLRHQIQPGLPLLGQRGGRAVRRHRADGGRQRPIGGDRDGGGVRRRKRALKKEEHPQMFRSDRPGLKAYRRGRPGASHQEVPAGSGPCTAGGGFLCFQLLRGRWLHCNTLQKERS